MIATFETNRIARFGRGATILRSRTPEPLDEERIREAVPSIFAEDKHESRSARYTYIPTIEVLRGLGREGFAPYEVRQGGTADEAKRGYTKHMVRLRYRGTGMTVGDSVREMVLVNSHDGTSSYQLMSGLFRMVCSNGLIVCESAGEMMRVPHVGDVVHKVIEGAYRIVDDGSRLIEDVAEMRGIPLSDGERRAFATAALELRYPTDGEGPPASPIAATTADAPRRSGDAGSDLWSTFNRLQENLVNGGQRYVHQDPETGAVSRRSTRPVRSLDGDVRLNRALWRLAEEMRNLKS